MKWCRYHPTFNSREYGPAEKRADRYWKERKRSAESGESMKRSCPYCGGVHSVGYECDKKPKRDQRIKNTQADKFRSTALWQQKRKKVKERDNYLCQVCLRKIYNTVTRQYNFKDLSVHHIEPLEERYDLRLADGNLITLCAYHHRMAEEGLIPKSVLRSIADLQNGTTARWVSPPGDDSKK